MAGRAEHGTQTRLGGAADGASVEVGGLRMVSPWLPIQCDPCLETTGGARLLRMVSPWLPIQSVLLYA